MSLNQRTFLRKEAVVVYSKPEIEFLGQARELIEQLVPTKVGGSTEPPWVENPAYDLDQ